MNDIEFQVLEAKALNDELLREIVREGWSINPGNFIVLARPKPKPAIEEVIPISSQDEPGATEQREVEHGL